MQKAHEGEFKIGEVVELCESALAKMVVRYSHTSQVTSELILHGSFEILRGMVFRAHKVLEAP